MRWFRRKSESKERSLRRTFVTPEGVDLQLTLGSAGARAAAFLIDMLIVLATLIAISLALHLFVGRLGGVFEEAAGIIWLLGFFLLRNGWFTLFEMGGRGATPGKRTLGLRVVARDGARLSGAAVVVRNAMREIEVFLPLSFLLITRQQDAASAGMVLCTLLWSGTFLFFPLFNRDRLRVGDLLAGTWVVEVVRVGLDSDLSRVNAGRQRWTFNDEALDFYGVYELQALEDVLRREDEQAMAIVAGTIRGKLHVQGEGSDYEFLFDYYAALCARLERKMMLGNRRANKFEAA